MRASVFRVGVGLFLVLGAGVAPPTERWDGAFRSDDSQRGGSLTVRIDSVVMGPSGSDTVFGHATLAPGLTGPLVAAHAKNPDHLRHSNAPGVLHFVIVRGQRGRIGGDLEPFIDPECDCAVVTRFAGTVVGALAEGIYESRGTGVLRNGRWRVHRVCGDD